MSAAPASISVIVPVHNGARFISDALLSVKSQTRPPEEIIVVDDGSIDDSAAIVRSQHPDVILITQQRGRAAAARNTGALHAHGEALAFLDHDDLWPPERNAVLLEAWKAHPEAEVVYGSIRVLAEADARKDSRIRNADRAHIPYLLGSLLIRRSCWLALGGMESVRDVADDVDFHLRLREFGAKILSVDSPTRIYRMHATNGANATVHTSRILLSALRAAVERRRA